MLTALFGVALAVVTTADPRSFISEVFVYIDEDQYCGAHPDSVTSQAQVEVRANAFRAPAKFMKFRGWATIALTLHIGADGRVSAMTITSENPPGEGLADAARKHLTEWTFTPGRPGDYCIQYSLTTDKDAGPPWDNPGDQSAPAPIVKTIPTYPQKALDDAIEADVLLAVQIATGGAVSSAKIIEQSTPDYDFGAAATRAVRQWRFPADTPPGQYRLVVKFRLA